jgi:sugar phosphate isomerase/epimerase
MSGGTDLLGLYWTLSGPVEVHVGREWSLFDLRDRCAHAARVGFAGLGLWHADLEHMLAGGKSLADMRALFDEYDLRYCELEFIGDWFLDPDDERRKASDRTRAMLFEAAGVLPAHHIKVGNLAGTECELPRLIDAYAELCEDATRYTDAKIVYEFMPYDAVVNTLDLALEVVDTAAAPNGGLAIDTWHLGKLNLAPDDLRRIPPRWIGWVELSDGPYGIAEEWLDEVINRRRLPGEGDFPLRDYVRVFRELGYDGPWGVEVLSEELRNLPIDQIYDRAYETTMAQLANERTANG